MSVREYIGARYVPIVADPFEWDNTRTYEPLTIVSHQGNSYTSRQYVPSGIDITNTQYWANTGNYNAQIEAYRQEVATFDSRITTLEGKFPVTAANISSNAVTSGKIANKAITPAKMADKILIVFGDSWSTSANGWINLYAQLQKFDSYKSYGVVGAAFLNRPTNLISSQITTAQNDTTIDKTLVTEVIVVGGVNDYREDDSNPADVRAAVDSTLDNIEALYPNAKVRYFLNSQFVPYPFNWYEPFNIIFNTGHNADSLIQALALNKYAYNSDNLHPSATGQRLIASYMCNKTLMSFDMSYITPESFSSTVEGTVVSNVTVKKVNDSVMIFMGIGHAHNVTEESPVITLNDSVLNNILLNRYHSILSAFTRDNTGNYAFQTNGGINCSNRVTAGSDYLTILTKLPY